MFTYTKFYRSTRPNLANYPLQSLRIYRSGTMKFRTTTASELAQWQLACIGCGESSGSWDNYPLAFIQPDSICGIWFQMQL